MTEPEFEAEVTCRIVAKDRHAARRQIEAAMKHTLVLHDINVYEVTEVEPNATQ